MTTEQSTKITADALHGEYVSLCAEFERRSKDDVLYRCALLSLALKAEQGRQAMANPDYAAATILAALYKSTQDKDGKKELACGIADINGLFSTLLAVGGKQAVSDNGAKGGRPEKDDMKLVRECFDGWQSNPEQYPSDAAFAREMMKKWGEEVGGTLASADSILKTMRRWRKEQKELTG